MAAVSLPTQALKNFVSPYEEAENVRWCYTCGTCSSSCPVGTATGLLRPHELVYHARLGRYEPMLAMRDIWYCIGCNRCSNLCPMLVKPSALLRNLQREAVARKLVGPSFLNRRRTLLDGLPRILWHAASALLQGKTPDVAQSWDRWRLTPPPQIAQPTIRLGLHAGGQTPLEATTQNVAAETSLSACFTCRACSGACPVCRETAFFEPVQIFRLAYLGQIEELLRSPAIWVCLDCLSCLPACSQGVNGPSTIHRLQELSRREGIVAKDFPAKWQRTRGDVFRFFAGEIDRLLDEDEHGSGGHSAADK